MIFLLVRSGFKGVRVCGEGRDDISADLGPPRRPVARRVQLLQHLPADGNAVRFLRNIFMRFDAFVDM